MASSIKKNTRSNIYLVLGIVFSMPVIGYANECSVLEYQNKKSSASQVIINPCLNDQKIGVGSVFRLLPEGRLWLKSKNDPIAESGQQLICRNKTEKAHTISVVSADSPWIQPKGFENCSGWIGNKLTCKEPDQISKLLFCAIATIKKSEERQEIQRRTSVAMRGLSDTGQIDELKEVASQELDQVADFIKAEINLCREAYQNQQAMTVEWGIQQSGEVTSPSIKESDIDPAFAECVFDVIRNFDYPTFPKTVQVSYQF